MKLLLLVSLLLAALASSPAMAGDAAAAALRLGAGVRIGSASALTNFPLSTHELCPVIAYATSVEPIPETELGTMKLAAGAAGSYASAAASRASAADPSAKAYRIVLQPLSYANGSNVVPQVDWADVHFRVNQNVQESLQMSATGSSVASSAHHAAASGEGGMGGMRMRESAPGAIFTFGPVFLSAHDTLHYGFTICSNMIDCNTVVHSFSPTQAEQPSTQQSLGLPLHEQQLLQQQQLQQALPTAQPQFQQAQVQQQPIQQLPIQQGKSPQQVQLEQQLLQQQQIQQQPQQAKQHLGQQPQLSLQHAAEQQPSAQPQPLPQAVQQGAACPAIAYTHKVDCGDVHCKVSFVNLSPTRPLDWVDVHVLKTDSSSLSRFLSASSGQPQQLALSAAGIPLLNFQMTLAAGQPPAMQMHGAMGGMSRRMMVGSQSAAELSSDLSAAQFGAASLPSSVLAESGGSQVWQFEMPLEFRGGDIVGLSFTYCANGIDCDEPLAFYALKEVGEQQQQQTSARARLLQPIEQEGQQQLQHTQVQSSLALGSRGSMQAPAASSAFSQQLDSLLDHANRQRLHQEL